MNLSQFNHAVNWWNTGKGFINIPLLEKVLKIKESEPAKNTIKKILSIQKTVYP